MSNSTDRMMRPILGLIIVASVLASACGGAATPPTEPPVTAPEGTVEAPPPHPMASLNLAARAGAVTETVHGREVPDPYRALEADTPETWAWIDAQTAYTEAYLEEHADPRRAARLAELMSIGYYGDLEQAGNRLFFLKRDGDAEQAILYVTDEGADSPRVLVDPNPLGETVAIDWFYASPEGSFLAYGLSSQGSERSTLHLLNVTTGEPLEETIAHTKWTDLAWLHDETGFYYTRYPREGEADYDPESEDTYHRNLFFHELGTNPADDPLVYAPTDRTYFVSSNVSPDDRYVVLIVSRGWSESDVYLIDRNQPEAAPITIVEGGDFLVYGEVFSNRLYLYSNEDHPRGRLLSVAVESAADTSAWEELISESEGTIEDIHMSSTGPVVSYVENVSSRLRLFDFAGEPLGEIDLPVQGSVRNVATQAGSDQVVFSFDSFFYPPTLHAYSPDQGLTVVDRVAADIDPSGYALDQVEVTSADGTPINVFLVHRRDLEHDGDQPVLLNGYGGFNASMMPGFTRNTLYWLEQGGVYALANIRGGGEFGEEWHRDGMRENKRNVFDDFEAVIRWLSSSGLSRPERIAIIGASNGGLLMGAMVTRCPDAFRAAVSSVGLYDMVRFTEFPPAEIWISEYGDPQNADEFAYLIDYSPYHNVVGGEAYPAVRRTRGLPGSTRPSSRRAFKRRPRATTPCSSS